MSIKATDFAQLLLRAEEISEAAGYDRDEEPRLWLEDAFVQAGGDPALQKIAAFLLTSDKGRKLVQDIAHAV